MSASPVWLLFAITALALSNGNAAGTSRGSVYDYINTKGFADGAKSFYLNTIASDGKRKAMISQAEEDCGGRYEGTSVNLIELSHVIVADKQSATSNPKNYTIPYTTEARVRWLVVETISCSVHGGHNQSVLHAALITGNETQIVTYQIVNDKENGAPLVSDARRTYKIEADVLSDEYRIPYSEQ
jgi:hypothetical protein